MHPCCATVFGFQKYSSYPHPTLLARFRPPDLVISRIKLKWQRSDTAEEIQAESQVLKTCCSKGVSNPGRNVGITMYAIKGTTLKGTEEIRTLSESVFL